VTVAASRRGPSTLRIYGISALVIAVAWAGTRALGSSGEDDNQLVLAAVAAIVLGQAALRDPFGMLCLIVCALPFSLGFLQFEIGVVTLNPYTLGITVAALVAVLGSLVGWARFRGAKEDLLVLLLAATFLVSTVLAKDVVDAGFLAFHGIFIPVVTYFALKLLVRTPEQYRKVLVAFVIGATAFAAAGIVTFIGNPERLYIFNMPPISAAGVMAAALIVVLYSEWWRRILGAVAAGVLCVGLIMTFSRGYMLLVLCTPVVYALIRRGEATKLMVAMLVLSLGATLMLVASYDVFYVQSLDKTQAESAARLTDFQYWLSSLYGRARYYSVGLEEFAAAPFFGNGFHRGFVSADGSAMVWHNFHVEWLEYGGLVAYVLYVSLLVTHFHAMARAARTNRAIAVNLTVVLTILVNGLMNSFTAGISPVLGFLFMALNRALASGAATPRSHPPG
jgi:hypothetical protein